MTRDIKTLQISDIQWHHKIKFEDGSETNGSESLEKQGFYEIDFKNKRVLDVGCLDGLHSFFAEQQGASEVLSIDINDEQFGRQSGDDRDFSEGYLFAHNKLNSKCKYIFPFSVYDLTKQKFGEFDIIFYMGLIYHLTNPVYALEIANELLKKGGSLALDIEVSNSSTKFYYGKEKYNSDKTNFWILHIEDLNKILDYSGFSIERVLLSTNNRKLYFCKKIKDVDKKYSVRSIYSKFNSKHTNYYLSDQGLVQVINPIFDKVWYDYPINYNPNQYCKYNTWWMDAINESISCIMEVESYNGLNLIYLKNKFPEKRIICTNSDVNQLYRIKTRTDYFQKDIDLYKIDIKEISKLSSESIDLIFFENLIDNATPEKRIDLINELLEISKYIILVVLTKDELRLKEKDITYALDVWSWIRFINEHFEGQVLTDQSGQKGDKVVFFITSKRSVNND